MSEINSSRLTDPVVQSIDNHEKSLRPQNLNQFIGQKQITENLKIFIE